jgi:hypothetical protein
VHAPRVVLALVLLATTVFVVGSGIAAIPYWENEPCISSLSETGPGTTWATQLVPYGTRCEREVRGGTETVQVLAPGTGELIAWLIVIAVVFGLAARHRRSARARGVALAAGVLGLFGLLAHQGEGVAPMVGAVVLGAPLVLAGDRVLRPQASWLTSLALCATLPLVVLAVWFAPGLMGYEEVAAALAALAGAGTAAAVERLGPRFDLSSPSSRPRPG